MIASVKGLLTTLGWLFKRPVTAHYPEEHLQIQPRYMGYPALLTDQTAEEPFCTGCMVCVRECPTQCMKAVMYDNPQYAEGTSHRRKIIQEFTLKEKQAEGILAMPLRKLTGLETKGLYKELEDLKIIQTNINNLDFSEIILIKEM